MSLYEMIEPKCSLADLVLPESVTNPVKEILEDHEYRDALMEAGLACRKKILFHGPPGCGKTSIAHALAKELEAKFYSVSLAQAVGSHLGESEKNVEAIFKFAQLNRVVMLLDEFDSIGSARRTGKMDNSADRQDNRMVNTVLTCIENRPPLGLIIGATNLFETLDEAVLRRFDMIIEVPSATRPALKKIANGVIKGRFGISIDEILQEASTPAAVVRVATDRLRRKVIEKERMIRAETGSLFGKDGPENARKITEMLKNPKEIPDGKPRETKTNTTASAGATA